MWFVLLLPSVLIFGSLEWTLQHKWFDFWDLTIWNISSEYLWFCRVIASPRSRLQTMQLCVCHRKLMANLRTNIILLSNFVSNINLCICWVYFSGNFLKSTPTLLSSVWNICCRNCQMFPVQYILTSSSSNLDPITKVKGEKNFKYWRLNMLKKVNNYLENKICFAFV